MTEDPADSIRDSARMKDSSPDNPWYYVFQEEKRRGGKRKEVDSPLILSEEPDLNSKHSTRTSQQKQEQKHLRLDFF